MILNTSTTATLQEINWYPYLTWAFYGALFLLAPLWLRRIRNVFTVFLLSLPLETAFLINAGFFIRPSYLIGLILFFKTSLHGLRFPKKYVLLLGLFVCIAVLGVFLNLDLLGKAQSLNARATFLRPIVQLLQLLVMIGICITAFTVLVKGSYFRYMVRVLHWVGFAIALSAMYELAAIYLHLPYLNLNNMLPHYWYPGFGGAGIYIFRARVTFIEPIELNNFQMLAIASSLAYRVLYNKKGWRYWAQLGVQLAILIGTFSRSTMLTCMVIVPMLLLWYPRKIKSALGLFVDRGARVVAVGLLLFVVYYAFTVTPEQLRNASPTVQTIFTRLVLHRNKNDNLSLLGRADASVQLSRMAEEKRLAFGVGIGNEVNWWGDVWGASSIYNQVILYTGLVGLSLFILFIGMILWRLFWNRWRMRHDTVLQQVNWIFFIGLLGMLTQRLSFSGLLNDTYLWVAFALCIYLGCVKRSADLMPRVSSTDASARIDT